MSPSLLHKVAPAEYDAHAAAVDHLRPSHTAGPPYNPAATLLKVAPAEVQRQAEAVLGYGSDLSEPLNSAQLNARQEMQDFANYMPTRVLELGQRAEHYPFPAGQAAAIHEQVGHDQLHWRHTCLPLLLKS